MLLKEKIIDISTGEEKIIERNATVEEIAEIERVQAEMAKHAAKQAEAVIAKAALLEKLGITADEAKLLLG